jgi:hypothetical protein
MDLSYPKDPIENLKWRTKMLRRASIDLIFREVLRRLFHEDILFAFNVFFYTLDVRKRPNHHLPFCTYPYQDKAIMDLKDAINSGNDRVLDKSRDMGVTWIVLATMFWFWCKPEGGADFLLGSRIEDYVDKKGDNRTHFAKVRYLLYRLPKWLRPTGFNPRAHDTFMKLQNPATESTFTGESNNPNFSTQGRYLAILYDEFAKWEGSDEAAWTAGGDASPCRIGVSTPFGAGGQFYGLVTGGKTKRITLHWSLHPEKALGLSCTWPAPNELEEKERLGQVYKPEECLTSPWYEAQLLRRTPTEIAQELNIDYLGAGNPVFDGRAWKTLQFLFKLPEEVEEFLHLRIDSLKAKRVDEPLDKEGFLLVYNKRKNAHSYTIGVDVVEGVEDGDFAFVTVFNRVTKDVDAIYYSRVDENTLARIVFIVSTLYSPEEDSFEAPWTGIETTGPGLATFDKALELGINNLFMAPRYDVVRGGVSYKKGWRTDANSRNELVSGIREWLVLREGKLNSQRLCGELLTFVRSRTGKPIAKSGCYDDGVMSFGIAVQVDQIAPERVFKNVLPVPEMSDFTMETAFESREEKTLEECCLATALERQKEGLEELYWEGI